ncbi:DUF4249 family protein [Portibacter marinus]|uniref:DUF4249 family protein n=1 Tax=Portibacter marinus TaxID=2898660 RepID=UPI001F44CC57|nr:DUF4249 family protein [Portibacter marinus]
MNQNYIFFIFVLLWFASCIDQIPVNVKEDDSEYLIVQAALKDNEDQQIVNITSNSPDATDFQANFPVNDALVYVLKDNSQRFDFRNVDDRGNYGQTLSLNTGSFYQLVIEYKGVRYESTHEELLEPVPVGELKTRVTNELVNNAAGNVVEREVINVLTDINLPVDEEIYLRYRIDGTYEYREIGTPSNLNPVTCYVDEIIDLNNLAIISNTGLEGGNIQNKLILTRAPDYRYSYNYCMHISQDRISKEAYEFWRLVENEFNRTGDIFEAPPGIIRGNINETGPSDIGCIGVFSVAAVSTKDFHILPSAVNNPRPRCQPFPAPPPTCTNCLLLPKSTLTKPECF